MPASLASRRDEPLKRLHEETGRLLAALQFFQRLALPQALVRCIDAEAGLGGSAHWFPVAGTIIALPPALVLLGTGQILPAPIAAALAIVTGLWLTGALHEDGLADCADGLGGGATRSRALEIMRDSAIGTFGACALIASVGLRWLALSLIADLTLFAAAAALLAAHTVSRGAITTALAFSNYARSKGTGSLVADGIGVPQWIVTITISILLCVLFAGWAGALSAIAALIAAALFLRHFVSRIGGYTGDALGAMQQITEIACLLALAGLMTPGVS